MKRILIVRHGKPNIDRDEFLKARDFSAWWDEYDRRGIVKDHLPSEELVELSKDFDFVLTSTSRRAIESAKFIKGDDVKFTSNKVFIEADLPAPPLGSLKLPAKFWTVISRFVWLIGLRKGRGGHMNSWRRAEEAAKILSKEAETKNVILFAHGFFNWMMSVKLSKRNYKIKRTSKDFLYWSYRYYEYEDRKK